MTYKQFVNRPLILRRKVEHKIEDVQLKWTICQSSTAPLHERVQTSGGNTTESSYIRYIDAKRELEQLAEELDLARNDLRDFLYSNLKNQDADMLDWRYIGGRTVQEIAEIEGMSYQTAKNRISSANRKAICMYQKK